VSAEKWTRYQFRWGLGQIAALLALFAAFQLEVAGSRLILGAGLLVLILSLRPIWVGKMQMPLTRYVPKVILVVVFVDFITSGGDVLPPMIRTLALLLTYRALEFRHPRQDRQLVLLALLLLLITGTLTADLTFAALLFVFVPIALFLLAVAVADDRGPRFLQDWNEPWRGFSWRKWWQRAKRRTDRRILAFAVALYGAFGISTMLLFWSLPRFDLGYNLPFFKLNSPQSMSGFSETVAFGSVVEIKQDFSVAMRVDAPPEAAGSHPYWRMMVLDEYFGRGFRQSESAREEIRALHESRFYDRDQRGEGDDAVWTHFIEGGISRQLPIPGRFRDMRFTARQMLQFNTAVRSMALQEVPANMLVVQMSGMEEDAVSPFTRTDTVLFGAEAGARTVRPASDGKATIYPWTTLALPDDPTARAFLRETVARILRQVGADQDESAFAAAATAWLRRDRGYSLQSTLGKSDHPVIAWMQGGEPGHCELYAASLVLLAREAGFPARLVTGFHGGVWNTFEDYFMVRNADAHAWVEILDPEAGWRRFDPTPGNSRLIARDGAAAFSPVTTPMPVETSLKAYMDSLRVVWYRNVVNFDHADQEAMVQSAGSILEDLILGAKAWIAQSWRALVGLFHSPLNWALYRELLPMALVAGGGFGLLWWVRRRRLARTGRLSAEGAVRRRAARWLGKLRNVADRPPPEHGVLYDQLLCLRYGPTGEWQNPPEVFKQARLAIRQASK
jgi:hypothetical protein